MSQEIYLAAALTREGRVLLLRPTPRAPWELPGGPLLPHHADAESAMDEILAALGVECPAIEDDFLETVYLPRDDGHLVYNLYVPSEWRGEPQVPIGMGSGWFALEELDAIEMDARVREALQVAFGLRAPVDDANAVLAALGGAVAEAAAIIDMPVTAAGAPTYDDRRSRGLDILRTLRGGDPLPAFAAMQQATPEIAADVVDFALGDVWSHPALDRRTRSLQVVAMLAALGGRAGPLRSHINGALNHGASPEQVVETLRMVAVYAGFPAALEAWPVMESVFQARGIPRPGATP